MSLKEIFCQERVIEILQRSFAADKTSHSYIFAGKDGVGRFKTACEFGKLLLCEKPVKRKEFFDSCEKCPSCRAFEAGSHPDFHHIYKELLEYTRDGKGKKTPVKFPIDVIREFLIEKVSNRPLESERKVFIVSEAEKLSIESQNALLKVLEEPPAYCCIILICTRLERLLPTTRSRCQMIRFGPVDEEKIAGKLAEIGLDKKSSQYFARLADGSIGMAVVWARLELAGASLYETKKEIIKSLAGCEYSDCLDLAQYFLDESKQIAAAWAEVEEAISKTDINRRALKTVIQVIISALYDAMKLNVTPERAIINFDQKQQIQKIADKFGAEQINEKINEAYRMLQWLDANVNERLIFEHLLLKLTGSGKIEVS
jgi:DNA polymerase-3 subunit delta'